MEISQIAAQLYTLREYTQNQYDVKETLKKVKAMGYDAVQVSGFGQVSHELVKSITDELKLKICCTHISYDLIKNHIDEVTTQHKLWDCQYVGLGSMPQEFRNKDGYYKFAREFSNLGKEYAKNGLKLIYHNHKFEFEKFDGKTGMDILLENSHADDFSFELDTYWVQAGGANPVEWIYKLKDRIDVIHFKDMGIVDDKQVFAEIGEGNLNWNEIIAACTDISVKWAAIEQDVCFRNSFDCLKTSYDNIKNMLK